MDGWSHPGVERLIRCHHPDAAPSVWADFLAGIGERVLVDLVAGTSAGGINGTLLVASVQSR